MKAFHCLRGCLFLFLLCSVQNAFAQYETANWLFSDFAVGFTAEEPSITPNLLSIQAAEFASYSSDVGKLLIATDGSTVWNGEGEVMKNGMNITPYRTRSMIIPKPGNIHQYYIFSYNAFNVPGNNNQTLSVIVYAIVDIAANNNKGEVLEKNKVLYNNMHGTFTISGTCDRSVFWLVGEVDTNLSEGSDKIYVFQIDKNGIQGPYISKPITIGAGSNFKLSPDASKLLITVTGNSGSASLIADFKPELLPADPIVKTKYLPATGGGEFSSSGRFIYIAAGNRLVQYDIQTESGLEIYFSADILGIPQMAANGKIYIPVSGTKKFAVINKPDLPGFTCDFNDSGIFVPTESFVLPSFASNLFYYKEFSANAGSDKEVCPGESVMLGSTENNATSYLWSPTDYLDDPAKLRPTFQYTGSDDEVNSFTYKLSSTFEGCVHTDLVIVKLNAKPPLPVIYGSKFVCPGVTGVQYWTSLEEGINYSWKVTGGTIAKEADVDTLTVNWGSPTPGTQVALQVSTDQACFSEVATLDISINAILKTELPQGLDSVCTNLRNQNQYQVTKTNGSVYGWGVAGGEIIGDPNQNKVYVNWDSGNSGKIWVTEKSITNEAVCLGVSDTLSISVFKDPSYVHLDYISLDEFDEKTIHLQASITNPDRLKELRILSRKEGEVIWQEMGMVEPGRIITYTMDNFDTDEYVYQFKVDMLNKCEERSSSQIHRSILLQAIGKEEINTIDLQWRSYNFWNSSDVLYEVLTAFTDPPEFELAASVKVDTSASIRADESLIYFLRTRAVRSDGLFVSLSNDVKLEFNREVVIYNVITPNNDGFNDTFEIKNIKLYPSNRLIIVNRYGQLVYDRVGYQGGWAGEDTTNGIYYYTLKVPEKNIEYKGWLHVIK